jgi:hypothetical protein
MAEAPKVMVVVDYLTQSLRVYSNLPNLMVEVEEENLDTEEESRDVELIKREYPYLQFGEESDEIDIN